MKLKNIKFIGFVKVYEHMFMVTLSEITKSYNFNIKHIFKPQTITITRIDIIGK